MVYFYWQFPVALLQSEIQFGFRMLIQIFYSLDFHGIDTMFVPGRHGLPDLHTAAAAFINVNIIFRHLYPLRRRYIKDCSLLCSEGWSKFVMALRTVIAGLILIHFLMWKRVSDVPAGGVKNDQWHEGKFMATLKVHEFRIYLRFDDILYPSLHPLPYFLFVLVFKLGYKGIFAEYNEECTDVKI